MTFTAGVPTVYLAVLQALISSGQAMHIALAVFAVLMSLVGRGPAPF